MRMIAALVALALLPGHAAADWQFTHWGDGLDTVLAYKVDGMRRTTKPEEANESTELVGMALAKSIYRASKLTVDAVYLFDEGKLTGVRLKFRSRDDGMAAINVIEGQYGQTLSARDTMKGDCRDIFKKWQDRERSNVVTFMAHMCVGDYNSISLLYTPAASAKDSGF